MAKKFVRGITDIKNIEHQDFDTNNVNDLLSDGKHSYIHRKKNDGSEEYHNLTNNIKTIQSDDTDLVSVTNYNNTTNSATIRPKHDSQKEQLLESTNETIVISHGENGTDETTTVDVNPAKVLEHDNLLTNYGLLKTTLGNTTTLSLEYSAVDDGFDLNNLQKGLVRSSNFLNAPQQNTMFLISSFTDGPYTFQEAIKLQDRYNATFRRVKIGPDWYEWREQCADERVLRDLIAQKQNTLTSNTSIGISGNTLRQLYTLKQTYSHANATLKTHVKSVSQNTSISTLEEEFHFLAKMDKGSSTATFTLNEHDTAVFENLIDNYGEDGSVNISGCAFSLSGSTLTFNCNSATYNPYVVSFSDIIPASVSTQSAPSRDDSLTVEILDETVVTDEIVDKTVVSEV